MPREEERETQEVAVEEVFVVGWGVGFVGEFCV